MYGNISYSYPLLQEGYYKFDVNICVSVYVSICGRYTHTDMDEASQLSSVKKPDFD